MPGASCGTWIRSTWIRSNESEPMNPLTSSGRVLEYALGKLTAEHVLFNRSTDSGVPLYMVRPFNCAGPGQPGQLYNVGQPEGVLVDRAVGFAHAWSVT